MLELVLCLLLAAEEKPAGPVVEQPAGRVVEQPNVEPSAAAVTFFESKIRPVLAEHCWKCHGSEKQWAGLRLDSRSGMLQGGDTGPAIVPGKPDESLLLRAVRHVDPDLKMPPESKLSDQLVADLAAWIAQGGAFPEPFPEPFPKPSSKVATAREAPHWAFRPPTRPSVPPIADEVSGGREATRLDARTEIDHFLADGWRSHSISPVPLADKQTLLRRVTFDLTGLPPTPEELADFLGDDRPDAYPRLIERLLASPAYGERWGRHWLDVARYADSNGLDENIAHGNAWRYRDFVVASLNADKPWSDLIREQLAGDLLPASNESQRNEFWTATGFLAIGPKVLAEVDQAKMRMDIIDEQVDSVGRVFLGMTFGCARCHDHKFDPIDAEDYYGLAGIFKSTKTMISYTKVAKWHEHELVLAETAAMRASYEGQLATQKQAIATFVSRADEQARSTLTPGTTPPEKLETLYPEATKTELAKLRASLAELEKNVPEYPAVMGVTEDQVVDVPIHLRGNPLKLGAVVPRRFPRVMQGPVPREFSAKESGRIQLADWLIDPRHPLTARVLVNRIWRWHFGEGLVRTTDNFGVLGEKPSHPELLDWLATRFVEDGWSLKRFQRRLLLSRAYQAASTADELARSRDPENRWLARFSPRRLEAEEIRDAMLAASGDLDRRFGGSMLQVKNRGYFFDHTSIDKTDYTSRRRSLYLPVVRNNVFDLFQLLDFPDPAVPTGDRATTTVPPQALLMMNSPFVMQTAETLADRVLATHASEDERLRELALLAYSRPASADELRENRAFLSQIDQGLATEVPDPVARQRRAWGILGQVVLASSEFIYVR